MFKSDIKMTWKSISDIIYKPSGQKNESASTMLHPHAFLFNMLYFVLWYHIYVTNKTLLLKIKENPEFWQIFIVTLLSLNI